MAISLGDACSISNIGLQRRSVLAFIPSLKTEPNMSAYRPDYLFQTGN